MNPIWQAVARNTVKRLMRVCPSCKRRQVVASSQARKKVVCKYCGAEIPASASRKSK